MTPDLNQMTTTELKHYLSVNRNNDGLFHTALQILIERSEFSPLQPYPFDIDNPESQAKVLSLLKEKLNQLKDI
jgi:hypothetical protein